MPGMDFVDLAWILPAAFTAVPLVHRLLPFKLPERAYPLFYFLVTLVCFFLPCRVDLALGAAGLLSIIHLRFGEHLAKTEPPDMQAVANSLALAWDHIVTHLPGWSARTHQVTIVHDDSEDDNPDDGGADDDNPDYQEPPKPPEQRATPRIAHL